MIRKYNTTDKDAVIRIWLDASILAHNFIETDYWHSKTDDMRNVYLPSATTYIYEEEGNIIGFVSMVENFVAAIFVLPGHQVKGIGKQLLNHIKSQYDKIELAVYKENESSVAFYKSQGFVVVREGIEEHTRHPELIMVFE